MSCPFVGKEFIFRQPDGAELRVRGWGNQCHATFETFDEYTVVKDPATGFYQYADINTNGDEFILTGIIPGNNNPVALGIRKNLRLDSEAVKEVAKLKEAALPVPHWKIRNEQEKRIITETSIIESLTAAPFTPYTRIERKRVKSYVGLCLPVQFRDVPGTIPKSDIEKFCNEAGYNGFGNNGSVYDYFYAVSGGKLQYTNIVANYCTTRNPRSYYTDRQIPYGVRAREIVKEALDNLAQQGFDFSSLSTDEENCVYAINILYAGQLMNRENEGLWAHASRLQNRLHLTDGKFASDYMITHLGSEDSGNKLPLATFCHENGHMLCGFPDLYDYGNDGFRSFGAGSFCLMAYGGALNSQALRNPPHINAYLKHRAGWASSVSEVNSHFDAVITAGNNEFFISRKNSTEYFIIENRHQSGRDLTLPASGLAVWHVDELGSNENQQMSAEKHYECSLMQADGFKQLENGTNFGDSTDLFSQNGNDRFADDTHPNSKWWDGTSSNLEITNISPADTVIRFTAKI